MLVYLLQILNENLAKLTAQFEEATAAKLKCQQEAEATQLTISLANRFTLFSSIIPHLFIACDIKYLVLVTSGYCYLAALYFAFC